MGVAFYIELDREELEIDNIDGKSVAKAMEKLTEIAEELGILPLESFMGQSMDDFSDLIDEEIILEDGSDGGAKWFSPEDGIATIDALVGALSKEPTRIKSVTKVLEDLADYRAALTTAQKAGAKWHLAIDI